MQVSMASVKGFISQGNIMPRPCLKHEESKRGGIDTAMATAQAASQLLNESTQTLQSDDQEFSKRNSSSKASRGAILGISSAGTLLTQNMMDTAEDHFNAGSDAGRTSISTSFTEDRKSSTDSLSMSPLINRHLIDEPVQAMKLPKLITETFPDVDRRLSVKLEHSLPSVREIIDDLRRDDETNPRRRRFRGISGNSSIDSDVRSARTLPRSQTEYILDPSMYAQPAQSSARNMHRELSPVLHFRRPALVNAHSAPEPVSHDSSSLTKAGQMEKPYTPASLSASSTCSTTFLSTTSASDSLVSSSQPTTVDTTGAIETVSSPIDPPMGNYHCTHSGCKALPFQTQYLLNSHANVHSQSRPHYCPVQGCPHGEGGKGFKRKNEMIRHGLVHQSPGYACPFCPEREHKYPRPDNLQRHVRMHHEEKCLEDPQLREILAQKGGGTRGGGGRRRRA